jgi:23S rRNA pseudouridine1911/1915/1917 synthase
LLHFTIDALPAAARLDRWLSEQLPDRARNQIQKDIADGRVRVNGEAAPARHRLREGDRIEYDRPEAVLTRIEPEAIPLNILFEDNDLLVLDKPAGLVVHPAPGHAGGTVANALLAHCGPALEGVGGEGRWGIVHRLDAATSGLMLAAKTQPACDALTAALARHHVRRQYLGLSLGMLHADEGTIDRPIGRRPNDRKRMGVRDDEYGRPARTDWRVLMQQHGMALLALSLHTGRTHQIRVHLQSLGHPILGDPDYGWTRARTLKDFDTRLRATLSAQWPKRQMLHAARLRLRHPIDRERILSFHSPPPDDMAAMLDLFFPDLWQPVVRKWLTGRGA